MTIVVNEDGVTLYIDIGYRYTMVMSKLLILPAIILLFSSCFTTANITENMSSAELIQRAQEAMDKSRYNVAIQYYQALNDRHRNSIDLIITAEYHIAHINYKQGRYELAREQLLSLLEYYNSPDAILYPQHFRVLTNIVLQNIEDRENQKRPIRRRR